MPKKTIIILGGGISGLTIAYDLAKHQDRFQIRLIEKSDHLGGWIDTDTSTGFFFEKGPRVFRGSRSPHFLALTKEAGLHPELIESRKEGQSRYLWKDGKLRRLPILSWDLVKGVMNDWKKAPLLTEDESVWDFACRRFNRRVAEDIFDPMVTGIFGGDIRKLSARSCFPLYKKMEEQHGSIIKGLLKREKFKGPHMFGFQRGMKSVIGRLQELTPIRYHLDEEVTSIVPKGEKFEVKTSKGSYEADYLFSALPAPVIGKLLIQELAHLPMEGAMIVNLGYAKNVLNKKGFGYLVSTKEKEDVMGVIFNSNSFPHYNRQPKETRLTVKLKDLDISENEARTQALKGIAKHLGIIEKPDVSMVIRAPQVFPQFLMGHQDRMSALEKKLEAQYPHLKLAGNYLYGVGVNDCIARARSVVESFLSTTAS
ncbi:MAG: protoporphyrinogen oxidase [Rhabdochlamydiaceae bacterium]|nr:protoporphyrinogen oxidase [Rhabdochlamydiaceae bacterium]